MSNEEKILSMLEEIGSDIKVMRTDVELLRNGEKNTKTPTPEEQLAIIEAMRSLLTQEEKDALGRYQEAEEARKRALYG